MMFLSLQPWPLILVATEKICMGKDFGDSGQHYGDKICERYIDYVKSNACRQHADTCNSIVCILGTVKSVLTATFICDRILENQPFRRT